MDFGFEGVSTDDRTRKAFAEIQLKADKLEESNSPLRLLQVLKFEHLQVSMGILCFVQYLKFLPLSGRRAVLKAFKNSEALFS